MGSLLVHREKRNITPEYLFYVFFFIRQTQSIEDSLYCVGTSLVLADLCKVFADQFKDPRSLPCITHQKKLLAKVVAITVYHDSGKVLIYVLQKKLDHLIISFCKFFLKIAGAWLGQGQLRDIRLQQKYFLYLWSLLSKFFDFCDQVAGVEVTGWVDYLVLDWFLV